MSKPARTALVTGAGRGLGREFVGQLLARGYHVLACQRDSAGAVPGAEVLRLDQGDDASIAALAAQLAGRRIDVLIHNAAIRGDVGGLPSLSRQDLLNVMSINVAGPLLLTQALIGQMPATGKVVFISSRAGSMTEGRDPDGDYAYCCSKAALNRAMVKLADDFPQIFMALHPGWVATDMGGPAAAISPAASVARLLPMIEAAGRSDSGSFRAFDGAAVDW